MTTQVITPTNRSMVNSASPPRRFKLVDAMALVAAMAVACGVTLWIDRASGGFISWSSIFHLFSDNSTTVVLDHYAELPSLVGGTIVDLICLSLPFFAVLTLTMVPIRLLDPRPRFRRLVRQPGTMAVFAASLGILIAATEVACAMLYSAFAAASASPLFILAVLGGVASYPGLAVFFVWMTLLLGRRWRAEPDWVDRAGRVFGAYWMTMAVSIPATILLLAEAM